MGSGSMADGDLEYEIQPEDLKLELIIITSLIYIDFFTMIV